MSEAKEKKPFDINDYIGKVAELKPKHTVEAAFQEHAGFPGSGLGGLRFKCPVCSAPNVASGEGKLPCPNCGIPLEIKRIA